MWGERKQSLPFVEVVEHFSCVFGACIISCIMHGYVRTIMSPTAVRIFAGQQWAAARCLPLPAARGIDFFDTCVCT